MTCIVGVQHEGEVYIGGDSAGVAGYAVTVRSDTKVFRNGPFVMGFTSSFRMGQLLHHAFDPPELPDSPKDLDKYMVTEFIDSVRACMKKGGYLAVEYSHREEGGTFLVGVAGRLFSIEDDFQVGVAADNYYAVGCGASLALGSLYSTTGQDPKDRVRLALRAAAHHNAGVTGPYTILKTK